MEQHTENQYDDDLTVEAGEYDEYYPTDAVDLFEFSAQEESPLSKLKSLILSIDWEITDEILIQFNDELVALKEIWAAEKYNLVYIQALEKISKYIYQQKANAHPDAIKLLLTFYYNLEQVVSSGDLTESQKKDILLKDVSRFQYLKRQIANQGQDDHMFHDEGKSPKMAADPTGGDDLRKLKSIVLGIDWEITDQDLNELRREVINLEEEYADSRPRLILLQGIGILGAYIKSKKSDAHADAFILLHYFFESLEKMARSPLSLEGEKEILFPAVEKFNTFKAIVGSTITSEPVGTEEGRDDSISPSVTGKGIQPAFADIPEDSVAGFQEDEEVKNLEGEESIKVADHIDSFFGENDGGTVLQEEEIGTDTAAATGEVDTVDSTLALEGADVSYDGEIEKGTSDDETEPMAVDAESLEMESPASSVPEPEIELVEPVDRDSDSAVSIDRELALQGVEVETEADDDSDEEALPIEESGKLAPALKDAGNLSESGADSFVDPQTEDSLSEEIAATLDGFFVDDQHMEEGVAGDGSVAAEQQEAEKKEEITTEIKAVEEKAPADEEVVFELLSSDSGHGDEVDEQVKEIVAVEGEEPDIVEMPEEIVAVEEMEEDVTEIAEEIVAVEEEDEDITEIPEEAFAIDEQEEDTAEATDEIVVAEETEESAAEIPEYLVAIEESEEEIAEIPEDAIAVIDQEKDFASDYIRTLGERIDDVSSEVEDWAIRDLSTEIDKLHDLWTAKPLEKSILQLLSTVTQHMEQYGPESNPESYGLLQSGYNALQSLAGDTEKNQEILFREMSRVLQWQQDMLIVGRFPTETVGDDAGGVPEEESVGRFQEIMGGDGDDSSMDVAFSTVDLKQEIAALRETLQSEIASLKEALRKE